MKFPAISEVRAYWEALRNGRLMPNRSEIDPRGIEHALEFAFILERIAPKIARFRLAGMHLNDLMGMEVRGMPITTLFIPSARTPFSEMLEAVFSQPATAEMMLTGQSGFGQGRIGAKLLLLPLKSDGGHVNRALGCLVAEGEIGRTPRRFDVDDAKISPIGAQHFIETTRHRAPGFAEASERYSGQPVASGPRNRAHLRLIKTDE